MSGPSARNLKQVITYWPPKQRNAYNEVVFDDPVLLKGVWTRNEIVVRNARGDEITTKAVVHVNQDVSENGYLALGNQIDTSDPHLLSQDIEDSSVAYALEIKAFHTASDLRYMETNRIAFV